MRQWKHIDILRLLPIAVFLIYGVLLLVEREAKSFIPLYIAILMLFLYFILTPVTFTTALIRFLATFILFAGLAMSSVGLTFAINLYPDIMQFKVYGFLLIGLILMFILFKLPAWVLNDT